ncbi:MAG: PAS domain S-box protein [Chloroflexi bacterium]|nr:PAS domain S-box protein [Chloroflexota bacterium]
MQPQKHVAGPINSRIDELSKGIKVLEETVARLKEMDLNFQEIQFIIYNYVEKIREGLVLIQDEIVIWANRAACDILGYELEEVINKSAVDLVHPKYNKLLSARFAMVQAGDEIPVGVLWPFMTKTREIKYVRPFSYRVMYMGRPAIMAFFYDVTEERKLNDESTLRAEMLNQVSDSVFLLDLKGNIKYVNKAVCDSMGYTQDEITKMNVVDINAKELKRKAEIRLKLSSSEKESRFKTVHVRKNRSRMPVDVRIRVINRGDQQFILGVVREILPEGLQDM